MVFPSPSLDFGCDLGGLPRRDWLSLLCRSKVVSASGRQFVYPRHISGAGRIIARSDACLSNAGGKDHGGESGGAEHFHHERERAIHGIESGIPDCISKAPVRAPTDRTSDRKAT